MFDILWKRTSVKGGDRGLLNRKNKRKDDFEMEETFYSESVVDSDSDEEAYHQIADIITGHSERNGDNLESGLIILIY